MNILQVNKFFYLRGGVEKHLFDAIDLLEKHGHTVIPFSMQDERNKETSYSKYFVSNISFDSPSFDTVKKLGRIIYSPEARKKMADLLTNEKVDIAHVHLLYHHLSPSPLLALREAGIPVVMTIHDWQVHHPNYYLSTKKRPYTVAEGKQYWRAIKDKAIKDSYAMSTLATVAASMHRALGWYDIVDTFIAPSLFVKEFLVASGWDEEKIVHIPHFIQDLPVVAKEKNKKPYLLYAGRLKWEKGVHLLLRYWKEHDIQYPLYIAGRGEQEKELRTYVVQHNLEKKVQFLGFLNQETLGKYMEEAAAIVQPTIMYETFGLATLEAWSHKTAAFVHDRGGIADFAKTSSAAMSFSLKTPQFAAALNSYMSAEERWYTYGQEGRKVVEEEYTAALWYKRIMHLYESLAI